MTTNMTRFALSSAAFLIIWLCLLFIPYAKGYADCTCDLNNKGVCVCETDNGTWIYLWAEEGWKP